MKIKYIILFLTCLLLLSSFTAPAKACCEPPAPPCHHCEDTVWVNDCDSADCEECVDGNCVGCDPNLCYDCNSTTEECEDRCDPNDCEECDGNGVCEVCDDDPNQFCCDGNCCDTDECEECIDGNCVVIDVNSVTVDANAVCVGCDVTFTVETDPCGYGDDVEWSAPGGDPNSGTGESFTTSWDTAGTHTATASLCDSNDSNDVTVVAVASLEPNEPNDPNAITEFDDGDGDPNTRSFIVCIVDANHDPNVITVIATPDPDVNEADLPDSWSFIGGTEVNDFVHTVDRTTAAKTELTCTCGTSSKTTTIYVVGVDKVVEEGTDDEGPLYVMCAGDTVDLEAIPTPADGNFPDGEPHWEIVEQPAEANAVLDPNSGSATTTLSNLNKGEYVVSAKCGSYDTGDNIVIRTPTLGRWESWVPGFGCPCSLHPWLGCGDCEASSTESPDDCGNTLTITCNNDSGSCMFQYWYNSTEVGRCVWVGGVNIFEYKITENGERFLKTDIHNCNDKKGVDSDGEGCDGYFCWRRVTFDCVDTSATPQVTWRKQDLEECPCGPGSYPGIGEECFGEDGNHPGYPN